MKIEHALKILAEHIIDCENGEYESYLNYCNELEIDPKDIEGELQKNHIYPLALIGLGLRFPE